MNKPADTHEIFLQPGEFHFGGGNTRIRTILGSCVSIIMWHEKRLIGGMCHYILPNRSKSSYPVQDGRYADGAIELFMQRILAANTLPQDYQVKIFGGGDMFPQYKCKVKPENNIPSQNVIAARKLVKCYGLNLVSENLGGAGHRQILFDIWDGSVWVKRNGINTSDQKNTLP